MGKSRRVKLKTYLKTNSQVDLGRVFNRTQGWVSQILNNYQDARLTLVDEKVVKLEYSVTKQHIVE